MRLKIIHIYPYIRYKNEIFGYLTTGFPGDLMLLAFGALGRLDDAIGVFGAA